MPARVCPDTRSLLAWGQESRNSGGAGRPKGPAWALEPPALFSLLTGPFWAWARLTSSSTPWHLPCQSFQGSVPTSHSVLTPVNDLLSPTLHTCTQRHTKSLLTDLWGLLKAGQVPVGLGAPRGSS